MKTTLVFVSLGVYAYAILKDDATISAEDLRKDLKAIVRQKIGAFAVPEVIQVKSNNCRKLVKSA